jgi:hypothetical protein
LEQTQRMQGTVNSLESRETWSSMSPAGSVHEDTAEKGAMRRLERNQRIQRSVNSLESRGTWSSMSPTESVDEDAAQKGIIGWLERNQMTLGTVVDVDNRSEREISRKTMAATIERHTKTSNNNSEIIPEV